MRFLLFSLIALAFASGHRSSGRAPARAVRPQPSRPGVETVFRDNTPVSGRVAAGKVPW
jgi:hypothetical protein